MAPPLAAGTSATPAPYVPAPLLPPVTGDPRTMGRSKVFGRQRARALRVRRTLRHVDPWSVFKISIILYFCLYVALMIAGVLLWNAAVGSGLVANVEDFITEVAAYEFWSFNGDEIFRGAAVIGAVLTVAGAAFNTLVAVLFNLISDIVGGVRVTVIEEDTARPIA